MERPSPWPASPGFSTGRVWADSPACLLPRFPDPHRHRGWLEGFPHHCLEVRGERIQVHLVPQAGREPLHRSGGVVAAPIEAAIDELLDWVGVVSETMEPVSVGVWVRGPR